MLKGMWSRVSKIKEKLGVTFVIMLLWQQQFSMYLYAIVQIFMQMSE